MNMLRPIKRLATAILCATVLLCLPLSLYGGEEDKGSNVVREIELPDYAFCLDVSPEGDYLAVAAWKQVHIIELLTGNTSGKLSVLVDPADAFIRTVDISPDGKYIAAGGDGVNIWSVEKNDSEKASPGMFTNRIVTLPFQTRALQFSPDSERLAIETPEDVIVVDSKTGQVSMRLDYAGNELKEPYLYPPITLTYNRDGSLLAVDKGRKVLVWRLPSGKLYRVLDCDGIGHEHYARISSLTFGPDGRTVLTNSFDHTSILWDLDSGSVTWSVVNSNPYSPVCRTPDAGECAPCHVGSYLPEKGPCFTAAMGKSSALAPDGNIIASGSMESSLILRNLATGNRVATVADFDSQAASMSSLSFSPDGANLVALLQYPFQDLPSRIVIYDITELDLDEDNLDNRILNLTDERDTKINLMYSAAKDGESKEAAEEEVRIRKQYDRLIEKEKGIDTVPLYDEEDVKEK